MNPNVWVDYLYEIKVLYKTWQLQKSEHQPFHIKEFT